ncbi:uncharacterized protein LOC120836942 [Ixodes scapularis]|uniref:uncharacterized protein LOC120836942 n=1 Tax=Ixodes scapularis TaxID=6945 RepID=UPI001A9F8F28|nr:uncharacterized protein LOC120836942 [Ixodes scapularis]
MVCTKSRATSNDLALMSRKFLTADLPQAVKFHKVYMEMLEVEKQANERQKRRNSVKKARQPKVPSPKPSNPAERLASRSSSRPGSKPRPPQLPRLPNDDYKIVIRSRGVLNLSSMSTGKLQDLIFNAAQTNYDAACADQIRINATQNSILISTPSVERARTYFNLHTLCIGEENYPLATYVADPANTSRGIIFDVPEYDTPDNISRYLIDYNHDLAILLARRMGKTNSVLIVFDSPEVPHWVSYHGAPYLCVLFKHKTEACNICWKIGHRADVCPSPRANKCPRCGIDNPPTDHDCEVKCAVCRGSHPTGFPRCKKRFQEHPAIRRRQAQRPVGDFSKSSTPPPPRGRSRERKSVPSEPGFRSRSRTRSRPRPRSRSRSKPRQVPHDEPPRQPAAPKQEEDRQLEQRIIYSRTMLEHAHAQSLIESGLEKKEKKIEWIESGQVL